MSDMEATPLERAQPEVERLAAGFAEHVVRWAQRAGCDPALAPLLHQVAQATSLATSNGHVCVLLSELAGTSPSPSAGGPSLSPFPSGGGQGWGPLPDEPTLRTNLLATGVVGTPGHPGSMPLILDADGRLYLHRYFDYEVRLARRLMQAAGAPPRQVTPAARELLDSLFLQRGNNEVDWQKIGAALALRNSLTVISGGPGTGKTTTVVNLLACLLTQEPDIRIALAAPTGKAAARMTEAIRQRAGHLPAAVRAKLPQESYTVHRLLGANPAQGRFVHDAANPIPCDALVVDEASMLDLALATRLLEAVPASARIILLGDKDQLAAVEAGAVFAELSANPTLTDACRRDVAQLCGYGAERIAPLAPVQATPLRDATVWLTKNYRFPAESAIGRLASAINAGASGGALDLLRESRREPRPEAVASPGDANGAAQPGAAKPRSASKRTEDTVSLSLFPELDAPAAPSAPAGTSDTSIRWIDPGQDDDVLGAILAGYARYLDTVRRDPAGVEAIFAAFNEFRVLCAVREGPAGVNAINESVARHAREALVSASPRQGVDPRSPWFAGRPVIVLRNDYVHKLFNGDIGIVLPDGGELAVFFPDGENGFRALPITRMPPHETAFAMTVHKAQGSEFEAALVVLPAQASQVATRELLYTAVTRAKERVMLSARREVLAGAVEAKSHRHSGLPRRLSDAASAMHAGAAPQTGPRPVTE